MAMTKKEEEMVEDLRIELALKFTEPNWPDLDFPKVDEGIVNGYSINVHVREVYKSCSSSINHGLRKWDKTSSKGPIRQYSSKRLALKALRNHLELFYARQLYTIDLQIKKELEEKYG